MEIDDVGSVVGEGGGNDVWYFGYGYGGFRWSWEGGGWYEVWEVKCVLCDCCVWYCDY